VAGHDATHVRDYRMQTSADLEILTRAAQESRVVISADTDFGTLLATHEENLPDVEADLIAGAAVVFEETRIRVRRLPIGGPARE
jgi:predicted nuclease of predicted toxin-antitoxin system